MALTQVGSAGVGADLGRRLRAELVFLMRDETGRPMTSAPSFCACSPAKRPSRELPELLEAIESFEALARRLDDAFRLLRARSSERLPTAVPIGELVPHGEGRASSGRNARTCLPDR